MALTSGTIEVRKNEGRSTASDGSSNGEFVQRTFDLTTKDGLEGYWAQLAQMSVDYRSVFWAQDDRQLWGLNHCLLTACYGLLHYLAQLAQLTSK